MSNQPKQVNNLIIAVDGKNIPRKDILTGNVPNPPTLSSQGGGKLLNLGSTNPPQQSQQLNMGISMQASNKQNTGLLPGIGNNKPFSLSGLFGNNANKGAQIEFGKQNPLGQPVQAGVNLINQTNTATQNKNIQIHSSTNSQDIGNQQNAGKTQGSQQIVQNINAIIFTNNNTPATMNKPTNTANINNQTKNVNNNPMPNNLFQNPSFTLPNTPIFNRTTPPVPPYNNPNAQTTASANAPVSTNAPNNTISSGSFNINISPNASSNSNTNNTKTQAGGVATTKTHSPTDATTAGNQNSDLYVKKPPTSTHLNFGSSASDLNSKQPSPQINAKKGTEGTSQASKNSMNTNTQTKKESQNGKTSPDRPTSTSPGKKMHIDQNMKMNIDVDRTIGKKTKQGTLGVKKNANNQQNSKNSSNFSQSYNTKSQFDIINLYHQVCEDSTSVQSIQINRVSQYLANLIGVQSQQLYLQKDSPKEQTSKKTEKQISIKTPSSNPLDRIQIPQLQDVPQPFLTGIKVFWYMVIQQFVKNHPYCTKYGIFGLIKYHIKLNAQKYFPSGRFNVQLFKEHHIFDNKQINVSSPFFINIQRNLQVQMISYVNQFLWIISSISEDDAHRLLCDFVLIKNIWNSFKILFNPDYSLKPENCLHEQIGIVLINCLLNIHYKNSSIFKDQTNFAADFIETIDSKMSIICKNFDVSTFHDQDKNYSTILGRKCIKFSNLLLLKFPYSGEKWDEKMQKVIKNCKTWTLYPFKWILNILSQQKSMIERSHKMVYFPIIGRQWLLLLKFLIKNMVKSGLMGIEQSFRQTIFYLTCSIIEENPISFWNQAQQYAQIYEYISSMYEAIQNINEPNGIHYYSQFGKFCRLMVCACGKSIVRPTNDEIPKQLKQELSGDSIMIQAAQRKQGEVQKAPTLSNLVYNYFTNSVLGKHNVLTEQLFSMLIQNMIIKQHILQENAQSMHAPTYSNQINCRYNYQQPVFVIYDLIIKMITDDPGLLNIFSDLWSHKVQQLGFSQSSKYYSQQFLYQITFGLLLKMQEYFNSKLAHSKTKTEDLDIISKILQLINSLIKDKSTNKIAQAFLFNYEQFFKNKRVKQMLQIAMEFRDNLKSLASHVQCLYQYASEGLQRSAWVSKICVPIIQDYLSEQQQIVAKYFANITRIVLYRKCLSSDSIKKLFQQISTKLVLDPQYQMLGYVNKNKNEQLVKIAQLNKYSDYLVEYISWALRIQEDSLKQFYFYNILYVNKRFDELESALKLLQILVVIYIKFHDRLYLNQNLRRFLSICHRSSALANSKIDVNNKFTTFPQIQLSNKKVATLPAVLGFLIAAPYLSSVEQLRQHQIPKAKQIRSIALNILNLIIFNHYNSFSVLTSNQNQSTDFSDLFRQNPISNLDFNIYQAYFVNGHEKSYHSSRNLLTDYTKSQICQKNNNLSLTVISWYQSSHFYGQLLDLSTQITPLFYDTEVRQAILQRVRQQLKQGQTLKIKMRNFLIKFDPLLYNSYFANKKILPSELIHYLCDQQILGYSHYVLQIAIYFSSKNAQIQSSNYKMLMQITELILERLLDMIKQSSRQELQKIIQLISINLWKTIRIFQVKKKLQPFVDYLEEFMPFILNPYHLKIKSPQYYEDYLVSLKLILGCDQYLDSKLYSRLKQINKLQYMLCELMENMAYTPRYYSALFYCLNFFAKLPNIQASQLKAIFKSVFSIINETINPLIIQHRYKHPQLKQQKKQALQLSQDITIISLMIFFESYIPEHTHTERKTGQKSVFQILEQIGTNFSQLNSLNYKSIFLNFERKPTVKSIQNALKIGLASRHYIQFVSACNHIYKAFSQETVFLSSQDSQITQNILKFVQSVFDLQPIIQPSKYEQSWRNIAFMKSWACNLLYVIVANTTSKSLLVQISQMLFNRANLLSLLGQLLTLYAQQQVKWPYITNKTLNMSKLSLLEKQLLHSILKVFFSLISRSQQWLKKTYLGNYDPSKNSAYFTFCKAIMSAVRILNSQFANTTFRNERNSSSVMDLNNQNVPKTQYELTLQKLSLRSENIGNLVRMQRQNNLTAQKIGLYQMFPFCQNMLELIHNHLNLLIGQKYLVIILGIYRNTQLVLQSYQFNDIIAIFEVAFKRLQSINAHQNTFITSLQILDRNFWFNYRMNKNLYYLNTIQQSLKSQHQILNNVAQTSLTCMSILRQSLQMHRDFREFNEKSSKIIRQAIKQTRRSHKLFSFDFQQQVISGGFQIKSQIGSYMYTPSMRFNK